MITLPATIEWHEIALKATESDNTPAITRNAMTEPEEKILPSALLVAASMRAQIIDLTDEVRTGSKISLLQNALHKNAAPLLISMLLTLLSLLLVLFTKYWVLSFLVTVPFAVRFAEHELTLRTALKRASNGETK
jgi:hypothetical protein